MTFGRSFAFVALLLPALLAGCGSSKDPVRSTVQGVVTLDGAPLAQGALSLIPLEGTKSPSAGAEITDGKYLIPAETGPVVGKFRVEITASRKTGRVRDEGGLVGKIEETEQYIPARYNQSTELKLDVMAGENKKDFALTSK